MDADKVNDLGAPTDGSATADTGGADEAAWAALTRQIEEIGRLGPRCIVV